MHLYFLWEYDGASKLAAIGMDDVTVNIMWALWVLFYISSYSDMDFAEAKPLKTKFQLQNSYFTSVKVANFIPRLKI
jgi:hypothetical protein